MAQTGLDENVSAKDNCVDCEALAENYDEDPLCHECWKAREANRVEAEEDVATAGAWL